MSKIICIPYNTRLDKNFIDLDVTSRARSPFSPFLLHDTHHYIMENIWQYSKVYPEHVDESGNIKPSYFEWRQKGLESQKAERYPMGRNAIPLYSYLKGEKLSYVEARKKIYIPMYTSLVMFCARNSFFELINIWNEMQRQNRDLYLRDFDGYNRHDLNMTLDDVINCETKKMGHCFVLEKMIMEYNSGVAQW